MTSPFDPSHVEVFRQLLALWSPATPFVLVGASALQCHRPSPRITRDLDLVVAVPLEALPAGLDRLPAWRRDRHREHEWHGPDGVYVDVIPAAPQLIEQGYVDWPSGGRMTLVGMEHALARSEQVTIAPGVTIPVAPLDVLAHLKIVSYTDRPYERFHDLEDLAFIIDEFIPAGDDRRWSDEIIDLQLDYDLVGAYLLGADLGRFLGDRDRARVEAFLDLLARDDMPTRAQMAHRAPPAWGASEDAVLRQLETVARGLVLTRS